jgi:alpha-L-rhamnosidase
MPKVYNTHNLLTMKSKNNIILCIAMILASLFPVVLSAQQATWIWYPGDYDIWLANNMQNRRTERGSFFPVFWKMDSHYVLVEFSKKLDISEPDEVEIAVEGKYNVKLDGKLVGSPEKLTIPAGKHALNIKVYNQQYVPAIFVKGKTVVSDNTWNVTFEDKEWIDESGKASDLSATVYLSAASWNFNQSTSLPSAFHLNTTPKAAVKTEKKGESTIVDFGQETFGYVKFHGLQGSGNLTVYYGESKEEAMATGTCETLDQISVPKAKGDYTHNQSKAFRYINIVADKTVSFDSVSMMYEYLPENIRGKFRCSDEQINKIWDIAKYTLQLNTREFFIDGIKRDRWVWSGDAYQSYLMNYYLFFDSPSVSRTLAALRGKDPVTGHINTIMDYTFYWFLGIYDYYMYTGDQTFIKAFYPRMVSMMDYCLGRRNTNGMMEGLSGDWVYVDWAPLEKKGEVSFEQLLFCRSLETMSLCADIMNDPKGMEKYKQLGSDLRAKLLPAFWNNDKGAFIHNRVNGTQENKVTRYTNMFAIFFGYLDEEKMQSVKKNVLLNDNVQKITTPYMRFYELEALCALGEQKYVMKEMKDYWGGMLNAGATSFWEKYDPSEKGAEHYAMYGRPFGKSLCHAWGASPIYLLGKYYLGVQPTSAGYKTYTVEPVLGGLEWMDGSVPTTDGDIQVYCSTKQIKVKSGTGTGILRFKSLSTPTCKDVVIQDKGGQSYVMTIEKGKEYVVNYKAIK